MGGNQNREHDEIVRTLRKRLEAIGCMTIHLQSFTVRKVGHRIVPIKLSIEKGWPDIICFRPDGSVAFYEVKTGGAVLNLEQRNRFRELSRRGAKIYIVKNLLMEKEEFKCNKNK